MDEHLRDLRDRIERLGQNLDVDALRKQMQAIEGEMAQPGFWGDRAIAQGKVRELETAKGRLGEYTRLTAAMDEIEVLFQLADEEDDEETRAEAEAALAKLDGDFERMRVQFLLSGPYDNSDCFLSLNAGAGGTDSQDWTEMLLRMYTRFCERAGFAVRLVDESPGEEAGLKSATLEVKGRNTFGLLRGETGVHRLVRIS
ncbi:MAG: PCRF domain-containing protein, partial [Candidatus Bipolaricaulota bacterium]